MSEHVDVLIVGAGLSGIGAAHHIQAAFPDERWPGSPRVSLYKFLKTPLPRQ